jgi:hypothetical protein
MDDPYPNDGSYYQPVAPEVTTEANKAEKRKAEEALPFIDDVLTWFEEVVAQTDSIALAIQLSGQYEKSIEDTTVALDIARLYLTQKKGELQSLATLIKK